MTPRKAIGSTAREAADRRETRITCATYASRCGAHRKGLPERFTSAATAPELTRTDDRIMRKKRRAAQAVPESETMGSEHRRGGQCCCVGRLRGIFARDSSWINRAARRAAPRKRAIFARVCHAGIRGEHKRRSEARLARRRAHQARQNVRSGASSAAAALTRVWSIPMPGLELGTSEDHRPAL